MCRPGNHVKTIHAFFPFMTCFRNLYTIRCGDDNTHSSGSGGGLGGGGLGGGGLGGLGAGGGGLGGLGTGGGGLGGLRSVGYPNT